MASDFTKRQNVILGVGLGVGIVSGIGLTVGFIALQRKLKAPSVDIRQEILALRRDVEFIRQDLHELSVAGSIGSQSRQSFSVDPTHETFELIHSKTTAAAATPSRKSSPPPVAPFPNASSTPKRHLSTRQNSDSEEEYFDAPDDEAVHPGTSDGVGGQKFDPTNVESLGENPDLRSVYAFVDQCLNDTNSDTKKKAYDVMNRVFAGDSRHCGDSVFLWRLSRVAFFYADTISKDGQNGERKKELVYEAKAYAFAALDLNPNDADIHKMCALTLGLTKDYLSISDSILMGFEYKKHIDLALELRPTDAVLHYLCGRWCWAVAELSWLERKAAAALFASPPTSSYDEALRCFLKAEKGNNKWIANKCYITKCYVALGEPENLESFVREGLALKPYSAEDELAHTELKAIAAKYKITC